MTPREQNILDTLNLLVLVYRSQKSTFPKLSEEQHHTLKITKDHLVSGNLNTAIFINTLHDLNKSGYLYALSVFEDKYHAEVMRLLDDTEFSKISNELEKFDSTDLMEKVKSGLADALIKNAPANIRIDRTEVMKEDLTLSDLLESAREIHKGYTPNMVSTVILSPFRSIERLLEKMNEGTSFDAVKDAGIWYDPLAFELHIDDTTISTAYQSKPTKAHFALQALFAQFGESQIDYFDIPEFDLDHKETEKKSYRDTLNRLLKKHPRLSELFNVHTDHLSIQGEFLGHSH